MSHRRNYIPDHITEGDEYQLPADVAHHVANVLRIKSGQTITLFNGQGGEYEAEILNMEKKRVTVLIRKHLDIERESPLLITLAQGISRGQKMDYTIQKAVELGCHRIVPVLNERSLSRLDEDRKQKKHAHWSKIIQSACEQCGRNTLPILEAAIALEDWLQQESSGMKLVLDPDADTTLSSQDVGDQNLTLLIGSEAGLDTTEIQMAVDSGFRRVNLGSRILRTETAAVVALGISQALWGDV